jgi:hypothetical protein
MLIEITAKLKSSIIWLKAIIWMITNRGNKSFGPDEIKYALEFFIASKKGTLSNYQEAEKFAGEFALRLWPKISPLPVIRVGPNNDSGYSIAQINGTDLIVSGGAGKNIDFEMFFAETGTKVYICDPFVDSLPKSHRNISHHLLKFESDVAKSKKNIITLDEFEDLINIDPNRTNLLKLDIEGSEISLLSSNNLNLYKYAQIVIEVHDMYRITSEDFRNKLLKTFDNLLKYHHVINFNSNNNGSILSFGKNLFPEVFELTLLHHKYFDSKSLELVKFDDLIEEYTNNRERLANINIFTYMHKIKLSR